MPTSTYLYADTGTTDCTAIGDPWWQWTATTGNSITWHTWITSGTATSLTQPLVWRTWIASRDAVERVYFVPETRRVRTAAEIEAADRAATAWAADRAAAIERARTLLLRHLSASQRDQFNRDGYFIVAGRAARYRVRVGRTANVDVIDRSGRATHRLCAHPAELVPDFDTMLAQKLALETDEAAFVRIANRHPAANAEQLLPAAA